MKYLEGTNRKGGPINQEFFICYKKRKIMYKIYFQMKSTDIYRPHSVTEKITKRHTLARKVTPVVRYKELSSLKYLAD